MNLSELGTAIARSPEKWRSFDARPAVRKSMKLRRGSSYADCTIRAS
jgi:hypothetical protein